MLVDETIPALVTEVDNQMLLRLPLYDEIKEVVFTLNVDGEPGPEGFGGHFYQTFWDIVSNDVVQSIHEFFLHGVVPPNINSNMIVLIPSLWETTVLSLLQTFNLKLLLKLSRIG